MTWQIIYESFHNNPRDVRTNPVTNKPSLWFYVYSENGNVYIDNARYHDNSSKLTHRRMLDKNNFAQMLDLNDRRNQGFAISKEATAVTVNQVYWYGILRDLQE